MLTGVAFAVARGEIVTRRYKAFISYSWADRTWGEWLHRTLETYRAPKGVADGKSLHPIFKDREEEAAGGSVGAAIEAALGASEFLIVICSPRSAQSMWVNREVAWFKTHKDKANILALIVDGEPGAAATPGREVEECFPKALTHKVSAALQPTEEWEDAPLAADARAEGDGRRGAKLKLAAALLGVGLDALVRRDERRRTIRRRFVTSAAVSLSAVMSVLAFVAATQRDAAVKAEVLAQAAQEDAEFQRDEAQDLVEFMLTDLRQRLDAVGRLDVLDAVAKRLLESYNKQDLAALDPDSLGRRARVLLLLGEVEGTRGKLDAALARYKDAAAATEELLERDPANQQRIFDHAQSVYWVGDIALKRGDMATVTAYWTQYRDYGARLVELDPNKDEWRTELAYGFRNLASIALDSGDLKSAEAGFRLALEISTSLAAKHSQDREMQIALAQDYYWLGRAQLQLGALRSAEQSNVKEGAIYAALLEKDPSDEVALRQKSVNGRVRARILMASGEAAPALSLLMALAPLHEERIKSDPENTRWLDYSGLLQIDTGAARLALGDVAGARRAANAAIATAERLLDLEPASIDWAIGNRWSALLLAARCALEEGAATEAMRYLALTKDLAAKSAAADTIMIERLRFRDRLILAHALERSGEAGSARKIAKSLTIDSASSPPSFGLEFKADFLDALIVAGETERAAALAADLERSNYRHPDFVKLKTLLSLGKE
jgi:tetratricopeptide (TPR) repeat protein